MAERVGAGRGAMGEDPFAGRHMRPGVAVAEHPRRESGEREQKDRDRSEAEPREASSAASSLTERTDGRRRTSPQPANPSDNSCVKSRVFLSHDAVSRRWRRPPRSRLAY